MELQCAWHFRYGVYPWTKKGPNVRPAWYQGISDARIIHEGMGAFNCVVMEDVSRDGSSGQRKNAEKSQSLLILASYECGKSVGR